MGKMIEAFRQLYLDQNGRCQNCGVGIRVPTVTNCAHVRSKNLMTAAEKLTEIVLVCEDLHRYEHSRANNLRKESACVKKFINKYGEDFKHGYSDIQQSGNTGLCWPE